MYRTNIKTTTREGRRFYIRKTACYLLHSFGIRSVFVVARLAVQKSENKQHDTPDNGDNVYE